MLENQKNSMKDMLKNMSSMFGGNPEMAEMFNNINPDDLQNFASQFSQDMANGGGGGGNNSKMRIDNNKLKTMKTKADLKKKLQAKQTQQVKHENNTTNALQASEQMNEADIDDIFNQSFEEVLQQEKKAQSSEQQKNKKSNKKKNKKKTFR